MINIFLSILLFFVQLSVFSQNTSNCRYTIDIRAGVFPDNSDSALACPVGACCFSQVRAKDNRFEIISFKLSAYKLCGMEDQVLEADNTGNTFTGFVRSILNKACTGSLLEFTCIKAKTKNGMIYTLQPFHIEVK